MATHRTLSLLAVSLMLSLNAEVHAQGAAESVRTDGFAVELQGLQSHDTSIANDADWSVESKFNERGLALRWELTNQWFIEGRMSQGRHLRYILEVEQGEDGEPQFEDDHGRTHSASIGVGKRVRINQYFSVRPGLSYMWRQRETPELYSDFNQQRLPAYRTQDHNLGASVAAEYRILGRLAVALNFSILSSGERQQGIGVAYYFY